MATRIKGITIEIGGNTTSLEKALSDVNKKIRNTQTELRDVEKLLKLDPGNVELLRQKYELLGRQVAQTEDKLNGLKFAQKDVEAAFKNGDIGVDEYNRFKREIIDVERNLNNLKSAAGQTESELKSINTSGLTKVSSEAKKAESDVKGIGDAAKNVGNELKSLGAKGAIALAGIGGVTEASREWTVATGSLKRSAERNGQSFSELEKIMYDYMAVNGDVGASVEGLLNTLDAGFDAKGIQTITDSVLGIRDVLGESVTIEAMSEGIRETIAMGEATGQYLMVLEREGPAAVEKFNEGLANCNTEAEKQQYILDQLANTELAEYGEKVREDNEHLAQWEETQGKILTIMQELAIAFGPLIETIGEFMEAYLIPLVEWLGKNEWAFWGLLSIILAFKTITGVFGVINTLSGIIGGVGSTASGASGKVSTLLTKIGSVITKVGSSAFKNAMYILAGSSAATVGTAIGAVGTLVAITAKYASDPDKYYQKSQDAFEQISTSSRLKPKGRATGGIVRDGVTTVGEEGPELLTTIAGKTIIEPLVQGNRTTNNNSVAMGGVNVNVYGAPGQDITALAEEVGRVIEDISDRKGRPF